MRGGGAHNPEGVPSLPETAWALERQVDISSLVHVLF
ncbi:hypothetical protein ABH941_003958 [Streptacidiphilus sp. EB103A]